MTTYQWTWISGAGGNDSEVIPQVLITYNSSYIPIRPGGISLSVTWTDSNGDLFLFGGTGWGFGGGNISKHNICIFFVTL